MDNKFSRKVFESQDFIFGFFVGFIMLGFFWLMVDSGHFLGIKWEKLSDVGGFIGGVFGTFFAGFTLILLVLSNREQRIENQRLRSESEFSKAKELFSSSVINAIESKEEKEWSDFVLFLNRFTLSIWNKILDDGLKETDNIVFEELRKDSIYCYQKLVEFLSISSAIDEIVSGHNLDRRQLESLNLLLNSNPRISQISSELHHLEHALRATEFKLNELRVNKLYIFPVNDCHGIVELVFQSFTVSS